MHNNTFILWLCLVFVETVEEIYKLHIYPAKLVCSVFFFSIDQRIFSKLYIHYFCLIIQYYNTKVIGKLDKDHYNSLPVKIAQQHRYTLKLIY